ncbi:MAG: SpoIIE family protein phosphatase [Acidobacteriota bacterium]
MRKFLLFCLLAILFAPSVRAQSFDVNRNREPMVSLDGLWRFHPGDDPRWADASFDDSGWSLLKGGKSWDRQGFRGLSGFAWYRARLVIPAGAPPQVLHIPSLAIATNYQVYADGKLLPSCSSNPVTALYVPHARDCQVSAPSAQSQTIELAIRVWHWWWWAEYTPGGLHGNLLLGARERILQHAAMENQSFAWQRATAADVLTILYLLAGLSAFALYLLRQREKEYVWFAAFAVLYAVSKGWATWYAFHNIGIWPQNLIQNAIDMADALSWIAFLYYLLRPRRGWLFWAAIGLVLLGLVMSGMAAAGWLTVPVWGMLNVTLLLPYLVWQIYVFLPAVYRGVADARLLLLPALLQPIFMLASAISLLLDYSGWLPGTSAWTSATLHWPFPFTASNFADFILLLAMVAILIARLNRITAHQERLASELEAARTVQQILVPEEIPAIPGFSIQSIYKPASQVGGDFFQILPTPSGGALIFIGDVSGKGMPAAMTVSLLVGTACTLAESTQSPAEILTRMNQRMIGRSQGGFTTCLVLRADADGRLTLANAGHLAPYVNGREIEVESGLPLGISLDSVYSEQAIRLEPGAQLALVTDGVVEAQSPTGELFGFDRTAAISTQSAESIAAAQQFGQEDDITVLTLNLVPSEVMP